MKYILSFDLEKIKEINTKGMNDYKEKALKRKRNGNKEKIQKLILDMEDLLILRFISSIGNYEKRVKDKADPLFFWVKYEALFDEYEGVLFLTKTALNARLNKYVEMGLIDRKCIRNEKGTFSFFKLTGVQKLHNRSERDVLKENKQEAEDKMEKQLIEMHNCTLEDAKNAIRIAKVNGASHIIGYCNSILKRQKVESKNRNEYFQNRNRFHNFKQRQYTRKEFEEMERFLLEIK